MNTALESMAAKLRLRAPENEKLRLTFCFACALRVQHLLEQEPAKGCLAVLGRYLDGQADREELENARRISERLANAHQGSASIDGCGHAAVSATYAVAKALGGNAIDAASYAAYAYVYAQSGYAAVADLDSFLAEHAWQVSVLEGLAPKEPAIPDHNKGVDA